MTILESIQQDLSVFTRYSIEIGVFTDKSSRKKQKVVVGMTNAELMFVHENGSVLNNIPARPVLEMTIDYAHKNLFDKLYDKCIELWPDEEKVELELKRFCMKLQSYARHIIYDNDGRLKPNSPRVAIKKKGNHPLFDTGQLARSITCRLLKDGEEKW